MTVVVENGTGLSNAEVYISLTDAKAYWSKRVRRWEDYEDIQIEAALLDATAYIDGMVFKGARLLSTQALEFPRSGLTDRSSYAITGLPLRVAQACAELAFKHLSEGGASLLFPDLDRGGRVTSESVGSISVTYADDAPAGKVFQVVDRLLEPYTTGKAKINTGPVWTPPAIESPQFSIGMNDYGSAAEAEA